ncbi:MAG: hypothetical protein O3A84_13925 [Proteobacteria bacterium]|nr:hypothetical protein [Pseudomonadota bacterium]
MSTMVQRLLSCAIGAAAISVVYATTSASAADYFKGKTITILVGFPGGSPATGIARMVAQVLPDHIPGKPTVIVKTMPGAGGLKASNFLAEKAKRDGLTLTYGPWFPIGQLIGRPGFRFKYENLTFIGGNRHLGRVVYARTDSIPGGLKNPTDIVKAQNLRLGGGNPAGANDLRARLSLDLLGVDYRYVGGYRGTSVIDQAMMRKEVDSNAGTIQWFRDWVQPNLVDKGDAIRLWAFPKPDDEGRLSANELTKDFPSFLDVYQSVHGKPPSGEKWEALKFVLNATGVSAQAVFGPPGLDKAVTETLRTGLFNAMRSDGWIKLSKRAFGVVMTPAPFELGLKEVKNLSDADPKIVAFLKQYVAEGQKGVTKRGKGKGKKGK